GAAAPRAPRLAEVFGCEVVAVTARTGRGLVELRAAVDRALRADRRADWKWTPSPALRSHVDASRAELPASWRSDARYGTSLPASDDALALWALANLEHGEDGDELAGIPPALRAAVAARSIERSIDDEPVLARWR